MDLRLSATNGAGMSAVDQGSDFVVATAPPDGPAYPQPLLYQSEITHVSIAKAMDVFRDDHCAEGADKGIRTYRCGAWRGQTGGAAEGQPHPPSGGPPHLSRS